MNGLEPVGERIEGVLAVLAATEQPVTGAEIAAVVAGWLAEWAGRRSRHWGSDSTLAEVVATLRSEPWTLQVLAQLQAPGEGTSA